MVNVYFSKFFLASFGILVTLILLNFIIALISETYEKSIENSKTIMIKEAVRTYFERDVESKFGYIMVIPVPFNIPLLITFPLCFLHCESNI